MNDLELARVEALASSRRRRPHAGQLLDKAATQEAELRKAKSNEIASWLVNKVVIAASRAGLRHSDLMRMQPNLQFDRLRNFQMGLTTARFSLIH